MKTLSIDEASSDLARWLQLALAGEEIGILSGGTIIVLRPTRAGLESSTNEGLSPRDALRCLQRDARLTASQAQAYLREVRDERLATEQRRPA